MAKKLVKQVLSWSGDVLTVKYPSIKKELVVDTSMYADEIQERARKHGYHQKFGDAASGKSPLEKYLEASAIHESLLDGDWEREGGYSIGLICEAVSKIQKVGLEKVLEAAQVGGKEVVKQWGSNAKVKAQIHLIKAARLAEAAEDADDIEIDVE